MLKKKSIISFLFFFSFCSLWCAESVFAVLESGPVKQYGIPPLPSNSLNCLYGSYSLFSGGSVEIWATVEPVPLLPDWKELRAVTGGTILQKESAQLLLAVLELRNKNSDLRNYLKWYIVFSFSSISSENSLLFADLFARRFVYFGEDLKTAADISFPAVLTK